MSSRNDRFAVVRKNAPRRASPCGRIRGRDGRARPAVLARLAARSPHAGHAVKPRRPLPLRSSRPQADCEVLEVGAGRGHSTIWLAAAARILGGRVLSLERDPEVAADWRRNIAEAGLEEWAELVEGDALETLAGLDDVFDVVFIDAKKDEYERYFELTRRLVDPGGADPGRQRALARGGARRLQPGAPERPDAPERHRPARQRARDDVGARALAFLRLSRPTPPARPRAGPGERPAVSLRGPRCRSGGRRTACPRAADGSSRPPPRRARSGRRRRRRRRGRDRRSAPSSFGFRKSGPGCPRKISPSPRVSSAWVTAPVSSCEAEALLEAESPGEPVDRRRDVARRAGKGVTVCTRSSFRFGRPGGMRIMAVTTERGWSDFDFRQYGQWR